MFKINSRIRNIVDVWHSVKVVRELFLVGCIEVIWVYISSYWLNLGLTSLRSPPLNLERLILFLVHGFKVKNLRFIVVDFDATSGPGYLLNQSLLLLKFLHLVFSIAIFVIGVAFEGKRIDGVLRRLLMVNIIISILPVWKFSLVAALLLARSTVRLNFRVGFSLGLNTEGLKRSFISSQVLHLMGIDDLVFFLSIKRIFLLYLLVFSMFLVVLFLVVSVESLGVGIFDKSI